MSANYPLNPTARAFSSTVPAQPAAIGAQKPVRIPLPVCAFLAYIGAITIFGKGPTYLFRPPFFIWGEMTLVIVTAWTMTKLNTRTWGRIFNRQGIMVALFFGWGFLRMFLSLSKYPFTMVVRDSMLWYYTLFFFFGAVLATDTRLADAVWAWLQRFWILAVAWMILNYFSGGFFMRNAPYTWRGVSVLSNSGSDVLQQMSLGVILLLMMSHKDKKRSAFLNMLLIASVIMGSSFLFTTQGRGIKIAVLGAFFVGFLLSFQAPVKVWSSGRWALIALFLVFSLGVTAILMGTDGLSNTILSRTNFYRFSKLKSINEGASTARWRMDWWENINYELQAKGPMIGLGFGPNLSQYNPFIEDTGEKFMVRSPHNISMSVYARMGYIGTALWVPIILLGIGSLIIRVRLCGFRDKQYGFRQYRPERYREIIFWLIFLICTFINSSFGVLMEGPVLGIWFWFALGFALIRMKDIQGTVSREPTY